MAGRKKDARGNGAINVIYLHFFSTFYSPTNIVNHKRLRNLFWEQGTWRHLIPYILPFSIHLLFPYCMKDSLDFVHFTGAVFGLPGVLAIRISHVTTRCCVDKVRTP